MAWYKTGTVSIVNGATSVSATGTRFAANARVGDGFRGPDGEWYEVVNIASETVLGIYPPYEGVTVTNSSNYMIAPLQGYNKESADRLRVITDGISDISGDVTAAQNAAIAAQASEDAAQISEDNAKTSELAAKASETNAATSASNASTSETNSANSATAANTSKVAAATSETNANTSKLAAKTSEDNAKASELAAASSQSTASTAATTATDAKNDAAASAAAALASQTAAATSETNAQADATSTAADKVAVEAARDITLTAKDQAETARDEAVEAAASVVDAVVDGGNIDLSSGSYPTAPAFSSIWKVSVGGTVSGTVYVAGDQLVYSQVTNSFYKNDNAPALVSSVGGFTGAVTKGQLGIDQTYTLAEKNKLDGVATGATANDTDANLKNRANHTGTQLSSTISDLFASVRADILNGGPLSINYQGTGLRLNGTQPDIASTAVIGFYDSLNVRDGYIGTGTSTSRDIYVTADAGNIRLYPTAEGVIGYHAGAQKFTTTSTGFTVTGVLTATSFAATALGVQDLNTIQTTGWWMQQANSQATLATNYPVAAVSGSLTSVQAPSGSMTTQTYVTYLTGETYTRSRYLTTWSAWKKTVNNEFVVQKLADINPVANTAFSLTHTLGFVPQFFTIGYRCKVADAGYAVGDTVYPQDAKYDSSTTTFRGLFIKLMDTTTVSGIYTGTGTVIPNKTTNSATTLTLASWAIEVTVGGVA